MTTDLGSNGAFQTGLSRFLFIFGKGDNFG
jgi:hypothetical protein